MGVACLLMRIRKGPKISIRFLASGAAVDASRFHSIFESLWYTVRGYLPMSDDGVRLPFATIDRRVSGRKTIRKCPWDFRGWLEWWYLQWHQSQWRLCSHYPCSGDIEEQSKWHSSWSQQGRYMHRRRRERYSSMRLDVLWHQTRGPTSWGQFLGRWGMK